jgi:hypothetical protein
MAYHVTDPARRDKLGEHGWRCPGTGAHLKRGRRAGDTRFHGATIGDLRAMMA